MIFFLQFTTGFCSLPKLMKRQTLNIVFSSFNVVVVAVCVVILTKVGGTITI